MVRNLNVREAINRFYMGTWAGERGAEERRKEEETTLNKLVVRRGQHWMQTKRQVQKAIVHETGNGTRPWDKASTNGYSESDQIQT